MPVIVVTWLRLRDPPRLDEFFTDAVAAIEQAMKPEGNLGADALADANNAWWSVTAWQERRLMQAYVDTEPHLGISSRLDHYCDEATFVPGEEAAGAFRSVQAGSARLIGPSWTLPYCGELQPKLQPADLPRLPVPQLAGVACVRSGQARRAHPRRGRARVGFPGATKGWRRCRLNRSLVRQSVHTGEQTSPGAAAPRL